MNIMITGIDGSVGTVLAKKYKGLGHTVYGIKNATLKSTTSETVEEEIKEAIH